MWMHDYISNTYEKNEYCVLLHFAKETEILTWSQPVLINQSCNLKRKCLSELIYSKLDRAQHVSVFK